MATANNDQSSGRERSNESRLLRFGVFEVDVDAGELRKNGARIRLQEQPFQVLMALLEDAGKVVTREDLRQKIWPADTFVDFDHSLNTAVNKIREALGDSGIEPAFYRNACPAGISLSCPCRWRAGLFDGVRGIATYAFIAGIIRESQCGEFAARCARRCASPRTTRSGSTTRIGARAIRAGYR